MKKSVLKYLLLFVFTIFLIGVFVFRGKSTSLVAGFMKPVSVVSKAVTDSEIKRTDGRTNLLILGVDRRSSGNRVTSALTDTIMILSIDEQGEKLVMISIPRDLWVENYKNKINSVYVFSKDDEGNYHPEEVANEVETILGIPIHYYAVVGFDVFTDSIDAIGGVDINVERAFEDFEYPIEGMENAAVIENRYKHLKFYAGMQKMNGETALEYSRSRHSTNPEEAGDFARARRQQNMIVSLKDTVLSAETLLNPIKIKELYDVYEENVETNITLPEILLFYDEYKDVDLTGISQLVLSNEGDPELPGSNVLEVPQKEEREQFYKGLYVLVPLNRTFDEIHALIRTSLFE